jgi:hypothetical protein
MPVAPQLLPGHALTAPVMATRRKRLLVAAAKMIWALVVLMVVASRVVPVPMKESSDLGFRVEEVFYVPVPRQNVVLLP